MIPVLELRFGYRIRIKYLYLYSRDRSHFSNPLDKILTTIGRNPFPIPSQYIHMGEYL